jgi:low affinity Fe/Cu permease
MVRGRVFARFAQSSAELMGKPAAFLVAAGAIILWAVLGPVFGFSDTWQLVINTATTIVTFLMVFLIQNTQNRQGDAVQLKLDELIRAVRGADNKLVDLEEASDEELEEIRKRYQRFAEQAHAAKRGGRAAGSVPPPADRNGSAPARRARKSSRR